MSSSVAAKPTRAAVPGQAAPSGPGSGSGPGPGSGSQGPSGQAGRAIHSHAPRPFWAPVQRWEKRWVLPNAVLQGIVFPPRPGMVESKVAHKPVVFKWVRGPPMSTDLTDPDTLAPRTQLEHTDAVTVQDVDETEPAQRDDGEAVSGQPNAPVDQSEESQGREVAEKAGPGTSTEEGTMTHNPSTESKNGPEDVEMQDAPADAPEAQGQAAPSPKDLKRQVADEDQYPNKKPAAGHDTVAPKCADDIPSAEPTGATIGTTIGRAMEADHQTASAAQSVDSLGQPPEDPSGPVSSLSANEQAKGQSTQPGLLKQPGQPQEATKEPVQQRPESEKQPEAPEQHRPSDPHQAAAPEAAAAVKEENSAGSQQAHATGPNEPPADK